MQELPKRDKFLSTLQGNNYSEKTIYSYQRDLLAFSNFLIGNNINFQEVTQATILAYRTYLTSPDRMTAEGKSSEKKLSAFSMNRMLSALRAYLTYLSDIGYETPISADIIRLFKTTKRGVSRLEPNEILALIEAPTQFERNKIVSLRNRALLEVLFATGMRLSELINLNINQIDKNGRIFVIDKEGTRRSLYLTKRGKRHLENYLEVRGDVDSPYLFIPYRGTRVHKKDKRISPNYLEYKVKQYRELLGLNVPISVHGIRRAFATYLAEGGASPVAIQILLGHESLDTTTRYVRASHKYAEESHKKFHPLRE